MADGSEIAISVWGLVRDYGDRRVLQGVDIDLGAEVDDAVVVEIRSSVLQPSGRPGVFGADGSVLESEVESAPGGNLRAGDQLFLSLVKASVSATDVSVVEQGAAAIVIDASPHVEIGEC